MRWEEYGDVFVYGEGVSVGFSEDEDLGVCGGKVESTLLSRKDGDGWESMVF